MQQCEAVQRLSAIKEETEAGESTVMRRVFAVLFPFSSAGWNAGRSSFRFADSTIADLTALKSSERSTLAREAITLIMTFKLLRCDPSSVPNFILAVIPSQIHPDTLNTMTAFAVRLYDSYHNCSLTGSLKTGGLLSDVFLHLVPHSFMGEHQEPGAHFVMVEEKRNILIGYGSTPLK